MNSATVTSEDIISRIEASLDDIRPYLIADGGNIKVLEITEDKTLRLEFMGNCGSCPMSTMTFKAGVEEAVKRLVPEIKNIEVINLA
jgi:Fe-S cluster biogenesis protein NfuA